MKILLKNIVIAELHDKLYYILLRFTNVESFASSDYKTISKSVNSTRREYAVS